jgi:hypothetical protein
MKNVVFIVSHLESGSLGLISILNQHSRLRISNSQYKYENPLDLEPLFKNRESDHSGFYYGDHLISNTSFTCKHLYKICKFIYVIRPAKPTINLLVSSYDLKTAITHYCLRIRRIYEMFRMTPDAVLLTWADMVSGVGLPLIKKYLELKESFVHNPNVFSQPLDELLPSDVNEAEFCYEKYLYKCKLIVDSNWRRIRN